MSTPAKFKLEVRRHPNATTHPFAEAFRPVSNIGQGQIGRLVPQLVKNKYDKILCTPTIRTVAVVEKLIATKPELGEMVAMVDWVYPQPSLANIWQMFNEVVGHTPNDFNQHPNYTQHFLRHCRIAAMELLRMAAKKSILLISHGVISQEILACIADDLFHSEIALQMRALNLKECDGIILNWDGTTLTHEYVPLGEVA